MDKEQEFTSTLIKLLRHPDRLKEMSLGIWKPITLQVSPTDKCNLNCDFCSVSKRKGDTIKISNLEQAIDDFVDLGIQSMEITGGGDPTMYQDINRLIDYGHQKGLSMGMITNGLCLSNIEQEQLDKLDWLRVSLSYLDFAPGVQFHIPQIKGTLGFSYVWNKTSNRRKIEKINALAIFHNAEYVRIVPDCKNVEEQQVYKKQMEEFIEEFPNMFFQSKPYDVHKKCQMGKIKPFLNSDGNVYHCSAAPLYEERFSEKWKICHMSQIKDTWKHFPEMDTFSCEKGKCFYSEQNKLLHQLEGTVKHDKFI